MNPMQQQQAAPQLDQPEAAQQMEVGGEDQAEEGAEINQEQLAKMLFERLDTFNEQEAQALARLITPETYPIFMKLLPEMEPLYVTVLEQSGGGAPQQEQPMPPGAGGQPQPGQYQPPEENPLVNDGGASRGLMG